MSVEPKKTEFKSPHRDDINLQTLGGILFVFAILSAPIYNKYDLVFKEEMEADPCRKEIKDMFMGNLMGMVFYSFGLKFFLFVLRKISNSLYVAFGWYLLIVHQFFGRILEDWVRGGIPECAQVNPNAYVDWMISRLLFWSWWLVGLEIVMGNEIVTLDSIWDVFGASLNLLPEVDEKRHVQYVTSVKEYVLNIIYWIVKLGVIISMIQPLMQIVLPNAHKLVLMNPDDTLIWIWFIFLKMITYSMLVVPMFEMCIPLLVLGGVKINDQSYFPICSRSYTEFWSKRWNIRVHKWLKNCAYKPTLRWLSPDKSMSKNWHKFMGTIAAFLFSGWMHEVRMFQLDSDRMWFDVSSSTFRYCGMWTKFCLINAAFVIGEKIMGKYIDPPDFIRGPLFLFSFSLLTFGYLLDYNTVWREMDHPLEQYSNENWQSYDWILKQSD